MYPPDSNSCCNIIDESVARRTGLYESYVLTCFGVSSPYSVYVHGCIEGEGNIAPVLFVDGLTRPTARSRNLDIEKFSSV